MWCMMLIDLTPQLNVQLAGPYIYTYGWRPIDFYWGTLQPINSYHFEIQIC